MNMQPSREIMDKLDELKKENGELRAKNDNLGQHVDFLRKKIKKLELRRVELIKEREEDPTPSTTTR